MHKNSIFSGKIVSAVVTLPTLPLTIVTKHCPQEILKRFFLFQAKEKEQEAALKREAEAKLAQEKELEEKLLKELEEKAREEKELQEQIEKEEAEEAEEKDIKVEDTTEETIEETPTSEDNSKETTEEQNAHLEKPTNSESKEIKQELKEDDVEESPKLVNGEIMDVDNQGN